MPLILGENSKHLCQQHRTSLPADKLPSLQMTDHDIVSFMIEAQSVMEEQRMFF